MDDQTDDWNRLQLALRQRAGLAHVDTSLTVLQKVGTILREGNWRVTAILDVQEGDDHGRLIHLLTGRVEDDVPLWGMAVDIGTTTVTVWLVDVTTGEVKAQASEYNGQIARGEDVVSRIIYASKGDGLAELRSLVLGTINELTRTVCKRVKIEPVEVFKTTIAGNSTMMHLLLGIPAYSIRLSPFVTAINQPPLLPASETGLCIHPDATVDCLPGVASYVGADISAGVLSSGVYQTEKLTLFLDVGTNGEIVLGSREWLVTCA